MRDINREFTPRIRKLSDIDKKILKVLLGPKGTISTQALATKLGIPRSSVSKRRNYLEKHFLELTYSLNLKDLGYRRIDLLVYTKGSSKAAIAEKLMTRDEVISIGNSIGEKTIDLRAEVVIKDNSQLLELLEEIKRIPDVKDVVWSEIVNIVGRKRSIPTSIIDKL